MAALQRIAEVKGLAPAVGPYSFAVVSAGGLVYTAGQIGLTKYSKLVDGGVEAEVHQAMDNLKKILEAAKTDLSHVLKATIYVTDITSFALVNKVYSSYFPDGEYPARETVGVKELPLGASVEISAIAVRPF